MFTVSGNKLVDPGEVRVPRTITPPSVWIWNSIIFGAVWAVLFYLFNAFWATVVTGLMVAASIWFGGIAEEEVDYHGHLLFNSLAGKNNTNNRRVIFPGTHQKLFWEHMEEGSKESLRRIISSEGKESLPTKDPAEVMEIDLTIHKRMNLGEVGEDEKAAENFIRFHSVDEQALSTVVRREILKKFSGYYGIKEIEDLVNSDTVQKEVFDEKNTSIKEKIKEMVNDYGISIGVILGISKPDEATKEMKRTPARAEALRDAITKLVDGGMDPELARRAALILDPTNDYSEERFDLNIEAPDLKNVRDITVLGGPRKGGKT